MFNAQTNPHGVRCTLEEYMVNLFGREPATGYANLPFWNAESSTASTPCAAG